MAENLEKVENWTQEEINYSVQFYLQMLELEKKGIKYNKKDLSRKLIEDHLPTRTSTDYRMMNISYVLMTLGLPIIKGYKPASQVGPGPKQMILNSLLKFDFFLNAVHLPSVDKSIVTQRAKVLEPTINLDKIPRGNREPRRGAATNSESFIRDPEVKAWVLKNAMGKCEGCQKPAPFLDESGEPFLEAHHMILLSKGGPDTIDNVLAVCPNCHRKCHFSNEKEPFLKGIYARITRLRK